MADDAADAACAADPLDRALELATKRLRSLPADEAVAARRLAAYLQRRGFGYAVVEGVVRQAIADR
jgi:SOS response regulatory protein OraA/RecX